MFSNACMNDATYKYSFQRGEKGFVSFWSDKHIIKNNLGQLNELVTDAYFCLTTFTTISLHFHFALPRTMNWRSDKYSIYTEPYLYLVWFFLFYFMFFEHGTVNYLHFFLVREKESPNPKAILMASTTTTTSTTMMIMIRGRSVWCARELYEA